MLKKIPYYGVLVSFLISCGGENAQVSQEICDTDHNTSSL